MSEEEVIKQLKKACIFDENCYEVDCLFEDDLKAIRGLFDLYNEEKEKNRIMKAEFERLENIEDDTAQLKLLLKEEKEKNQKILSDNIETFQKLFAEEISKIYISKDKIREKINELRQRKEKMIILKMGELNLLSVTQQIDILKELLGE